MYPAPLLQLSTFIRIRENVVYPRLFAYACNMAVWRKTPLAAARKPYPWVRWSKDRLLDTRICDLNLEISGSVLESRIAQLYRELEQRDFRFTPHFWLSDEWYCPDEVPGVAIPFFLAHPRLHRLEQESVMEVEGGTRDWCMRLLRHETAHATGVACSDDLVLRIRTPICRNRTASATCSICPTGTRRHIRTRTGPRPSPSG
jgi:hypothetical protein